MSAINSFFFFFFVQKCGKLQILSFLSLLEERDNNVRLRGEAGILRKRFAGATKDGEENRGAIQRLGADNARLASAIRSLEKDISELKREVRGRDEAVAERERRIAELKRGGVELAKNRYVLEHKIEDLRSQIEPKDEAIADLRAQIEEMEDELNAVSRTQSDLESAVGESRSRAAAAAQELVAERKRAAKMTVMHSRLLKDVAELTSLQDSKLVKQAAARLAKKHLRGAEARPGGGEEGTAGGGGEGGGEEEGDSRALEEIMR